MTDDSMLAAVRDCLTTAHDSVASEQMARPASDIIARGRRRRLRHGLAATVTAAVIAAATAGTLLSGNSGNGVGPAKLAAWTVTTKPGGELAVTIRELRDPAGLERRLQADGVPATVRFTGQIPRSCLDYPLSAGQASRLQARIFPQTSNTSGQTAFTIDANAIPARIGLWITASTSHSRTGREGPRSTDFAAIWTFVYASGHCSPGKSPQGASGGGAVGSGG